MEHEVKTYEDRSRVILGDEIRLTEIGKIKLGRLGEERQKRSGPGTFRLPVKLPYFLVTGRERGEDGNFEIDAQIHAEPPAGIGPEPTELPCMLPSDVIEEVFQSEYVQYDGRTKIVSCDGETAWNVKQRTSAPCPRQDGGKCQCKSYCRLSVHLEHGSYFGGVHVLRSTSWETEQNIKSSLRWLEEQFGFLKGLPLVLKLYPATVEYEDTQGKRRTGKAFKVGVFMRGGFESAVRLVSQAVEMRQAMGEQKRLMLGAGLSEELDRIDTEEEADIADEFFPDAVEVEAVETEAVEGRQDRTAALKGDLADKVPAGASEGSLVDLWEGRPLPNGYVVEQPSLGWYRPAYLGEPIEAKNIRKADVWRAIEYHMHERAVAEEAAADAPSDDLVEAAVEAIKPLGPPMGSSGYLEQPTPEEAPNAFPVSPEVAEDVRVMTGQPAEEDTRTVIEIQRDIGRVRQESGKDREVIADIAQTLFGNIEEVRESDGRVNMTKLDRAQLIALEGGLLDSAESWAAGETVTLASRAHLGQSVAW